ncbi:unnamed protein product [Thlaspi arvense]|uniref:F-box domain-containing protein n=1 Tax=Thlaspi arvense TaxID=13288 RepID=A0AAU9S7X8_THLAR|nr:unnamed protein product [Thlaspi arvense]
MKRVSLNLGDIIDPEMSSRTRAKKKKPQSLILSLPEDVIVDILARVSRFDYPILSLVSKHFRSLVASPEIYARRSLLGCTEHCLYALAYDRDNDVYRWYILRRKANGNSRFVLIPSLPAMPSIGSIVAVGSMIYVFGGINKYNLSTSALTIDCRSHTAQPLTSIPEPMFHTIADIMDRKIYVTGYSYFDDFVWKKVMVVFNTETQKWEEPGVVKANIELGNIHHYCCVVMSGKLYTRDDDNSYVYDPMENKWETDEMLHSKKWNNAHVVDGVLYYFDRVENIIRTYDPKQRCWGVVKGVEKLLYKTRYKGWSKSTQMVHLIQMKAIYEQ